MTRGEVTFLFHREEKPAIQTSCFINFRDPEDHEEVQEIVLETLVDFADEKLTGFKCVTAVVDIAELDYYYTAMFVPEEGNITWTKGNETIH